MAGQMAVQFKETAQWQYDLRVYTAVYTGLAVLVDFSSMFFCGDESEWGRPEGGPTALRQLYSLSFVKDYYFTSSWLT